MCIGHHVVTLACFFQQRQHARTRELRGYRQPRDGDALRAALHQIIHTGPIAIGNRAINALGGVVADFQRAGDA